MTLIFNQNSHVCKKEAYLFVSAESEKWRKTIRFDFFFIFCISLLKFTNTPERGYTSNYTEWKYTESQKKRRAFNY